MARRQTFGWLIGCALAWPAPALAVTIDFETGFTDNEALSNFSFADLAITFSTINPDEPDLTLVVEAVGESDPDAQGFLRDANGVRDDVDPGLENQIGDFFLRTGGAIEDRDFANEAVFRIDYGFVPVGTISGEIWDIDGNNAQGSEAWLVEAFDTLGTQIGSIQSPIGTTTGASSLDGDVWTFAFDNGNVAGGVEAVAALEFSFVGTKTTGIGLAFDNFVTGAAPDLPAVPLPAGFPLMLATLAGSALVLRGKRG
ncbi:MAG: VPLPA-CTERM sorting domain-containing protein [Pseudomonadota bacterium]